MRGKSSLPTVAPVMWSIVAQAIEERRVIIWRSEDPRATQVEAESHRGIGVEGRDRLHDGGWLCQLTLQIGTRGCMTLALIFSESDTLLLGVQISLECRDLVALRRGEGLHTTGVGVAGITRTF